MRAWLAGIVGVTWGLCLAGQEPATGRITGRVVDALAEPVALAEVTVARWQERDRVLARTRTDADGFFVLGRVPFGSSMLVTASAAGRVTATEYVDLSAAAPEDVASLRLWDAGSIAVRVLDGTGAPLAGSEVCAAYDDARGFGFDPQAEGRTDADGTVTLAGVPLGCIQVRAWAPGFGVGEQVVTLRDAATTELRLVRDAGIRLDVRVKGLPASSRASISVIPYGRSGAMCLPARLVRGEPDANGCWCVAGLPAEWEYLVSPHSETLAFAPRNQRQKGSGGDLRLEFTASPIQSLVLRGVLRDPTGEPLAGQRLECRAPNGGVRTQAVTGDDGRFTIDSPLAPGTQAVIYLLPGEWALAQEKSKGVHGDLRSFHWHEFEVDVQRELALRAVRAAEVRGVLVDADGKPVPLHAVTLQEQHAAPHWMAFRFATTRRNGSFVFAGVRAPSSALRVGADDMGTSATEPFTLQDGARVDDLRVVLATPATIGGTVRDATGAPVPGARVWLRDWDFARNGQRSGNVLEILADREGRYRFPDVAPGGHYLQVVEGFGQSRTQTEPFELEGGAKKQIDLTLP